jgi:hypothetical protein
MENPYARDIWKNIELLQRLAKGEPHPMRPDVRIVEAAVDLWRRIKAWPEDTRKTFDAFDPKASGDLGDFLIAMDKVVRSLRDR